MTAGLTPMLDAAKRGRAEALSQCKDDFQRVLVTATNDVMEPMALMIDQGATGDKIITYVISVCTSFITSVARTIDAENWPMLELYIQTQIANDLADPKPTIKFTENLPDDSIARRA
jgi:hypothetical protein